MDSLIKASKLIRLQAEKLSHALSALRAIRKSNGSLENCKYIAEEALDYCGKLDEKGEGHEN